MTQIKLCPETQVFWQDIHRVISEGRAQQACLKILHFVLSRLSPSCPVHGITCKLYELKLSASLSRQDDQMTKMTGDAHFSGCFSSFFFLSLLSFEDLLLFFLLFLVSRAAKMLLVDTLMAFHQQRLSRHALAQHDQLTDHATSKSSLSARVSISRIVGKEIFEPLAPNGRIRPRPSEWFQHLMRPVGMSET